jgi:hypothetical protein
VEATTGSTMNFSSSRLTAHFELAEVEGGAFAFGGVACLDAFVVADDAAFGDALEPRDQPCEAASAARGAAADA